MGHNPVVTVQLRSCSMKAATDDINEWVWLYSNKILLAKNRQHANCQSLLTPALGLCWHTENKKVILTLFLLHAFPTLMPLPL